MLTFGFCAKYGYNGGIPYTTNGTQITSPPRILLFFVFSCFNVLG